MAIVDMGTISARGQIAIPSGIRQHLGLEDGSRVLFVVEDDVLMLKKINTETFAELTRPFREARKKVAEGKVPEIVHKSRANLYN